MSMSSWLSEWKPPISARASRRTDMLAPMSRATAACCLGETGVRASEHPVELERKPARPSCLELRQRGSPNGDDGLVAIGQQEPVQPIRIGPGIVIQERPRCHRGRPRRPNCGPNRGDLRTCWQAPPPGSPRDHLPGGAPLLPASLEKGVVVIDTDDDLDRGPILGLHRCHRSQEKRPAILRVCTDHDGNGQVHLLRRQWVGLFDNCQGWGQHDVVAHPLRRTRIQSSTPLPPRSGHTLRHAQ